MGPKGEPSREVSIREHTQVFPAPWAETPWARQGGDFLYEWP